MNQVFSLASLITAMLTLTSCGAEAFNAAPTTQNASAAGGYASRDEYDIVLIVDDTGSMYQAYPAIQQQFPAFLAALPENFHATIIPMTTYWQVTQVVGSQYDSNSSNWTPAWPGESSTDPSMLPASVFRTPSNYTAYVTSSNMSTSLNGMEPTFQNMLSIFSTGIKGDNLFRTGSQKIFVFIGNGNDSSGVNFCTRSDNVTVPCEQIAGTPQCTPTTADPIAGGSKTCGSQVTSMNYYENQLNTQFPGLIVYAVVANSVTNNCLGGSAYTQVGSRYQQLATYFSGNGGGSGRIIDLCSQAANQSATGAIGAVLTDMASYIVAQNHIYQVLYVAVNANEVPNQVTVQVGGSSTNTYVVPQGSPGETKEMPRS